MYLIVEVESGPDAPGTFALTAGQEVVVGRMAPARINLAGDRTVSRQHFALAFDGRAARVRDLNSSHGTIVNGQRVSEALVVSGSTIQAGATVFRVRTDTDAPANAVVLTIAPPVAESDRAASVTAEVPAYDGPSLDAVRERAIATLRSQERPLFAVLDAARDPLVLARLHECPEERQSLYEGPQADRLAAAAPYLVSLPRESVLLEALVRDGWGESWGVYLTCDQPFAEVRRQLRRSLTVQTQTGKRLLFRFYDPRVLRVFLPTCTREELAAFFGPIEAFLHESADGGALVRSQLKDGALASRGSPLR